MEEFLARSWDMILDRAHGLFHVRLVVQPAMAAILAVRAGLRDARENRPPFGWALLAGRDHRGDLLREGWNDVAQLFFLAFGVDAVYEVFVFHWFYPGQSLIVAIVLAFPTYLLTRGPTNRAARFWRRYSGQIKPKI